MAAFLIISVILAAIFTVDAKPASNDQISCPKNLGESLRSSIMECEAETGYKMEARGVAGIANLSVSLLKGASVAEERLKRSLNLSVGLLEAGEAHKEQRLAHRPPGSNHNLKESVNLSVGLLEGASPKAERLTHLLPVSEGRNLKESLNLSVGLLEQANEGVSRGLVQGADSILAPERPVKDLINLSIGLLTGSKAADRPIDGQGLRREERRREVQGRDEKMDMENCVIRKLLEDHPILKNVLEECQNQYGAGDDTVAQDAFEMCVEEKLKRMCPNMDIDRMSG